MLAGISAAMRRVKVAKAAKMVRRVDLVEVVTDQMRETLHSKPLTRARRTNDDLDALVGSLIQAFELVEEALYTNNPEVEDPPATGQKDWILRNETRTIFSRDA